MGEIEIWEIYIFIELWDINGTRKFHPFQDQINVGFSSAAIWRIMLLLSERGMDGQFVVGWV